MTSTKLKARDHSRIIFALVQKDMLNAIKNKGVLTTLITVTLMVILYRFLPAFEQGDILPTIAVFDQSGSDVVSALTELEGIYVFEADSVDQMKSYLANRDYVSLGVVLPVNFDELRDNADEINMEGYFISWADEDEIRREKSRFEKILSEVSRVQVHIHSDGNIAYSTPNSTGLFFLASVSMVICFTLVSFSVSPYLMLDEKSEKTLDVLLVSPAQPLHILLGKAITAMFYCFLGAALLIAIYFPLFTQWWLAALCFLLGAFLLVILGLILGMLVETKQHLMVWMWVVFPLLVIPPFLTIMRQLLPPVLIQLLNYLPTVALTILLRLSFAKVSPLPLLIQELGIVLGFTLIAVVMLTLLLKKREAQ